MNELPFAPASERNRQPILDRLLELLPSRGSLLEIGSGTGQHAVFFAPRFEGLEWQTSERAGEIPGLAARLEREGSPNIPDPLELDVLKDGWPERKFNAIFSANTSHIMCWEAVCAMFEGVGNHLLVHGRFCLYGPFNRNGAFTAPSNEDFHRQLLARNAGMGLRDIEALETLALGHQMELEQEIEMPVNNLLLVFQKVSQ